MYAAAEQSSGGRRGLCLGAAGTNQRSCTTHCSDSDSAHIVSARPTRNRSAANEPSPYCTGTAAMGASLRLRRLSLLAAAVVLAASALVSTAEEVSCSAGPPEKLDVDIERLSKQVGVLLGALRHQCDQGGNLRPLTIFCPTPRRCSSTSWRRNITTRSTPPSRASCSPMLTLAGASE